MAGGGTRGRHSVPERRRTGRRPLIALAMLGVLLPGKITAEDTIDWRGRFDPKRKFLEARAVLQFATPEAGRLIWLPEGLRLDALDAVNGRAGERVGAETVRCLRFQERGELEIRYSGRVPDLPDPHAAMRRKRASRPGSQEDRLIVLSGAQGFLPRTAAGFRSARIAITLPREWSCLGSGAALPRIEAGGEVTHVFEQTGGGIGLALGHFEPIGRVGGAVPAVVHGWKRFDYQWHFRDEDIARILGIYRDRYGPPGLPGLNILFRRGRRLGGISFDGLVIIELEGARSAFSRSARRKTLSGLSLTLHDAKLDLLTHELAHQWWGGTVSAEGPADRWITEGLATYSSLVAIRAWKGEKAYRLALGQLRRQVIAHADRGAPAASAADPGRQSWSAHVALVYGKPALMLALLADAVGEAVVCARLKGVLGDWRGRRLETGAFLLRLAGDDEAMAARLARWISERGLPSGI